MTTTTNRKRTRASQTFDDAASVAAETLVKLMTDPKVPANTRFRAAIRILDYAYKGQQQDDLHDRVAALEDAVQDRPAADETSAEQGTQPDHPQDEQPCQVEETPYAEEQCVCDVAAQNARWEDYLKTMLPTMAKADRQLIEDALPTLPPMHIGETQCIVQLSVSWRQMTPGQRLALWFCERYADHRAGRKVCLTPAIAQAVMAAEKYEEVECSSCGLTVPPAIRTCPLCGGRCAPCGTLAKQRKKPQNAA